ncbi:hypothetical protein [Alteromonas sp. CYL-A6]|uniref:hypothetical protein n=1 Tax=Alteromonas nitratireducens TaxID=3390813 RepID=UPI0034B6A375
MLKTLLLTLLLIIMPSVVNATNFYLDEYTFSWVVAREGDVKLSVEIANDSEYLHMISTGINVGSLRLTAEEAIALGNILTKTRTLADKQRKAGGEQRETIENVTFRTSEKYGFSVSVGSGMLSRVSLTKSQAIMFSEKLIQAEKMIAFAKSQLPFN